MVNTTKENFDRLTQELMECTSRGKAFTLLGKQNFTKAQLLDYADHLSIYINAWHNKDLIRASIVAATTGAVLNSKAIQGRW